MANLRSKTATTTFGATDLIYILRDPSGTPLDRKMAVADFFKTWDGNRNVLEFASLSAAVSAIGSSQATLVISVSTTVSASLTIPATLTLVFTGSSVITVASGQTLTVNSSPSHWPLRTLFAGAGSVKLPFAHQVFPQWYGATLDGVADDTAEMQAAINSWPQSNTPHAGGDVILTGAALISDTLTIQKNSIVIKGTGWGSSNESPKSGYIKWNGSAGIPMLLLKDTWESGVENIRLIGKSSAKPSAAIEFERTALATTMLNHSFARRIFIGPIFGYDSDDLEQFDAGIVFSGTIDGDTNLLEDVHITKCGIGVDVQNPNASVTQIDTLKITACDIGLKTNSFTLGNNWNFGGNAIDLYITSGHRLIITDFTTEGSTQYIVGETSSKAYIKGGGFEVTNSLPVSGYMIDMDQGSYLELRNSHFVAAGSYDFDPLYKIRVKSPGGGAGYQSVVMDGVTGIQQNQIDVTGPGGNLHRTMVIFRRPPSAPNDVGSYAINYLTTNEAFDEKRVDFTGAFNNFGGPFKVRQIVAPTGLTVTATGGTGTTYSYKVSAFTADGETLPSSAVTVSGHSSLDATHFNEISWSPVIGATGYKLYGRIGGSELLLATRYAYDIHNAPAVGSILSYKDDGSVTPSGAQPTANTTGNATIDNRAYFGGGTQAAPGLAYAADATQGIFFGGTGSHFVQGGNDILFIGNGGTVQFNFAGPVIPDSASFQWFDGSKLIRSADGVLAPKTSANAFGKFEIATGVYVMAGSGSPEGVVTANVGSLYMRTDGSTSTTLYVKTSGTGNTGWTAK